MKNLFSALAIMALTSTSAIAEQKLPTGSRLDYKEGSTHGTAITPDGEKVEVEFSGYTRWWLKKDQSEQSAWLDLWLETIETIAKKYNPDLTFVLFMTDVMNNKLEIDDLNFAGLAQSKSKKISPYAEEIAKNYCSNYRKGMSYDAGRDQAEKVLSDQAKRDRIQVVTLGSDDKQPTVIGVLKYATDINSAVARECSVEASRVYSKGSKYDGKNLL